MSIRVCILMLFAASLIGQQRASPLLGAVPSADVPLEILRHRLRAAKSNEEAQEIQRQISQMEKERQQVLDILSDIVKKATDGDQAKTKVILTQRMKLTEFECHGKLLQAFSDRCFRQLFNNQFALGQLFVLVNLCQTPSTKGGAALRAVDSVCQQTLGRKKYARII